MLGLLLLGFLAGLAWGLIRAGPAAWAGALAALTAFGYNPSDPLAPLVAFAVVFGCSRVFANRCRR